MITHLLAPGSVGGLETVVRRLVTGIAERGRDVSVIAVLDDDPESGADSHPFVLELEELGIPVVQVRLPPRAYMRERRACADAVDRLGSTVVHTHGYRPDVVDSGVGPSRGIPRVSTVHGFTGVNLKGRIFEWIQRRALRRFDAVIAVSDPLGRNLARAGVPGEKIHVIENAWDPEADNDDRDLSRRRLDAAPSDFHLGWVGRLSREKGADVLLEAVALLPDRDGIYVSVIGDGPERRRLEESCAELSLGSRVRFHGVIPDAARLFEGFDAVVLSSRTEGLPIVLLEAVAARVPAVATAVGGVPDVLPAGTGLTVPPEDPSALARGIQSIREDPSAAAARAEKAHARAAIRFSKDRWLDAHLRLYDRLTGGQSSSKISARAGATETSIPSAEIETWN